MSRSDVSALDSIQRESRVTGANAMASSADGSGTPSAFDRTNRSRNGVTVMPGSIGFQIAAGASVGARAIFRGPVRRSRYCASVCLHVAAACCRSAGVIVTCISFSASANVAGETAGPEPVPVPKVGGAPAVGGVELVLGDCSLLRHAAATRKPTGARMKNWRRVFIYLDSCAGATSYAIAKASSIAGGTISITSPSSRSVTDESAS